MIREGKMVRDVQTGNHNQVTEAVKSLRSTPVGCNLFKSFVRMEGIFNFAEEFIVVDHPEPNQCQSLGDPECFFVSFLGSCSLRESHSMIAPTGLCWNSKARVD